ncbi:transposase [Saccharolobus solfataricus]|uniref:Transposase n=1 Tax=Saccharolobus solfataricus TaxID=2287 RepID=A0A7S9ILZ9_SACSO|nr:transposase [Saccharolobus solfataricus]
MSLLKVLLIKLIFDISWNNLEGEIRDSKRFMDFLGGKIPPKSTVFSFYKKLQQTVIQEGETMRTTLMDELNKALDKVISEYREKGFELEVGREKTIGSRTTT